MSDSPENAGFVAPDPAELAPLFPGYDIQGLIASGGMGAVYSARQRSLDRNVAIKILPMELSGDAAFCAGFEAEAKAMARLNHPNLIGVYDFGEVNGMLYIIMEFVPGKSIYHSAYGIAIDQLEVIRLVTGICEGLAHAHEHGIIHRDIKPSNILLDVHAHPKIGDFGLARPVDLKIDEGEEIYGTPHYTAPEVVNAPHSVDHRADIFSVGVLLHELLTGKLPADDPRPASTIVRCDPKFDTIIRRATQHIPSGRYSSAKEIAHDLQTIAQSLAPKAPRAAPVAPKRPSTGQHRSVQHPAHHPAHHPVKRKKTASAPMFFIMAITVAAIAAYALLSRPGAEKSVSPPVVIKVPSDSKKPKIAVPPEEGPMPDAIPKKTTPSTTAPPAGGGSRPKPGTTPAVTPTIPSGAESKFDVRGFFARARKIMQDRAKSSVSAYRSGLSANIADFERSLKKQLRKLKTGEVAVDRAVDSAVAEWRTNGGRIPDTLGEPLDTIPDIGPVHAAALQKQSGIDDTFQAGLATHAKTYVDGLQLQIDRLKKENDPGAIALIEAEIKRTRASDKYFADLMLGIEPEQE